MTLTPAGVQILRQADDAIADGEQRLLAPLGSKQRDQLYSLLRQIADGIDLCPAVPAEDCSD
jgi:hypothetical protein